MFNMFTVCYKVRVLSGVVLVGLLNSVVAKPMDLSGLVQNSPFPRAPAVAQATKLDQNPTLELRGMVVENELTWFTLYEAATKKWMTVREGAGDDILSIKEINREKSTLVLNYQGRTVVLSMNNSGNTAASNRASISTVAVVAPMRVPQTAVISDHSIAEGTRLDLVARLILQARQREINRSEGLSMNPS